MELINELIPFVGNGLQGLWDTVLSDWVGPIFIAAVAVFAIMFVKDRAWMKLIGFIGIAAIVGVLVFGGSALFGSDGSLTNVSTDLIDQVGN